MLASKTSRGFTLVELLVVIGIIAVLIGILLPTVARARRSAFEIKSLSNLRQMLFGYTAYAIDNRGQLLYGYPPDVMSGVAVTADDPVSHQTFGSVVACRYPWRLLKYCSNLWPLIHAHGNLPALTQRGDSAASAFAKAYALSLNPTYGINAVFVGGHKDYGGFNTDGSPDVGKHVVFRSNQVHRPTDLIVFADCTAAQVQSATAGEQLGYAVLMPPHAAGTTHWTVVNGQAAAVLSYELVGLPHGWYTKNVVTGFFDGHAEAVPLDRLTDMRLWADQATTPDYDYK